MHPVYQKSVSAISQGRLRVLILNFQDMLMGISKSGQRATCLSLIPILADLTPDISDQNFGIEFLFKIVKSPIIMPLEMK